MSTIIIPEHIVWSACDAGYYGYNSFITYVIHLLWTGLKLCHFRVNQSDGWASQT